MELDASLIDDVVCDFPKMEMALWQLLLSLDDEISPKKEKEECRAKLMEAIEKWNMGPLYKHLCEKFNWSSDSVLGEKYGKLNKEMLEKYDEKLRDAQENLGENEIRLALLAKANYLCQIGDKEDAIPAFEAVIEKSVGVGNKMEAAFALLRIGIFFNDNEMSDKWISQLKQFCEHKDSDWERRNRLLVYEGAHLLRLRQFKEASELLLKTLATFSAVELMDLQQYIYYALIAVIVGSDRETLKNKVIESPEVIGNIELLPHMGDLLYGLFKCEYSRFVQALGHISDQMKRDIYLWQHAPYYCREMRILAYNQYLQSYSSVTIAAMARAFGYSVEFMDKEISRFIAAGRIFAKIDKVDGVISTTRPDPKSGWYTDTIKEGDALLNKVEKLARVFSP